MASSTRLLFPRVRISLVGVVVLALLVISPSVKASDDPYTIECVPPIGRCVTFSEYHEGVEFCQGILYETPVCLFNGMTGADADTFAQQGYETMLFELEQKEDWGCLPAWKSINCFSQFQKCDANNMTLKLCGSLCENYGRYCSMPQEDAQCTSGEFALNSDGRPMAGPSPLCTGTGSARGFFVLIAVMIVLLV